MVDTNKSYTDNGYKDPYGFSSADNPCVINLRSKWKDQKIRGIQITGFTGGYLSVSPTSTITARLQFENGAISRTTQFYGALNQTAHNHQSAFIIPYDASSFRHIKKVPENSLTYFSDEECYLRDSDNDSLVVTFYDENDSLIDFQGNKYFLELLLIYGHINKTYK